MRVLGLDPGSRRTGYGVVEGEGNRFHAVTHGVITPTAGKELTILEQLLGNVGRFSGPRQETNPGAPTGGGGTI